MSKKSSPLGDFLVVLAIFLLKILKKCAIMVVRSSVLCF